MFKIIHTSDWHLGQHFFTRQRKNEHEQFIQWLAQQVQAYQVDAVVVAGDIFDTSTPPSYARELYNQFVLLMQKLSCQVVILAGNHDSVSVLNESRSLLKQLNTQVISRPQEDVTEQLITLADKQGNPAAVLAAVPFIRPADIIKSQGGESGLQKRQNLGEAIARHYQALYETAQKQQREFDSPLPVIMTGHLAAVGVSQSESVRDIYIGNLDGFAVSAFPPADYIALGHIHRAQCLNSKTEHSIYYSGSPIPLSFDELNQSKTVNLVSFESGKCRNVELLEIPVFQQMRSIRGDLAEIDRQIQQLPKDESIWLSVQVTTQDFLSDLQQRISDMTAESQVEVLQLSRGRKRHTVTDTSVQLESLAELNPMRVFERRLALEEFATESEQQSEADKLRVQRLKQHFRRIESDIFQETNSAEVAATREQNQ